MAKVSSELQEVIKNNISYLATSSKDGRPNVVQVGLVWPIGESELLLVDIWFKRTRRNLEENSSVALAVMDMARIKAYQLKGRGEIITEGEMFDKAFEIMEKKAEIRKAILEGLAAQRPELKERIELVGDIHGRIKKPKAVVLMRVEEIYSTIPTETYREQ